MKHALVVYESMFGNTKEIAEAVAEGLRAAMTVEVVEVGSAPVVLSDEVGLLVVGGPTHAFSMSRPSTRADAATKGADKNAAAAGGLREWVEQVGKGAARPSVAAFDTKVKRPMLPGSAARAAIKLLRRAQFPVLTEAENFYVDGTAGPLIEGEPDRARNWGAKCAAESGP
ncbi:flavodoxin family protein [Lentzea kentuckyensis]|uniref:flavodoxin family protein n=1 Tax=Lentzea kentuckyensis TaxID=360086 RepID=UPI000A365BC0|nr:flavodoxin domain-containing protein [Lentzea kentuckyensis]